MLLSIQKRLSQLGKRLGGKPPKSAESKNSPFAHVQPTDQFIASFPRSGNTWLRYLIADIILQNRDLQTTTSLPIHADQVIPDLDRGDQLESASQFSRNRLLKTHSNWNSEIRKAVVIYRNPIDCLTSYFHFHLRYENMKPLTQAGIDEFCAEQVKHWQDHLHSFKEASKLGKCDCYFLSYEDLHTRTHEQLASVLDFLNIEHSKSKIARAIENHQFGKHAKNEQPKVGTTERFFRKGEIGSGRDELNPKTIELLERIANSNQT